MKKMGFTGIALLITVMSLILMLGFERISNRTGTEREKILASNLEKAQLRAKMKLKARKEGKPGKRANPDKPDMFAKFHKEIRTREGDSEPRYPLNYKMTELQKAKRTAANRLAGENLTWISRGPGNVAGRTRGLVVDPDDPDKDTWFAGTVGGGIWKTTDAGLSWENKSPDLPNLATTVLVMAESNHNVMYAGTGEGFFNADAIAGDGIWKSTDRGETWTQISSTAGNSDFKYINRMVVDPADENVLVVATNTGIFRSTDGGAQWTNVFSNGQRMQHIISNPKNFNTQFASSNSRGVFKSTDGGQNWGQVLTLSGSGRIELAIAGSDTSRIYAASQSPSARLFMSQDAGTNWNEVIEQSGSSPNWLGSQGWYDNAINVHPFNADIVYVGGINIYRIDILPGNYRDTNRLTNWYPGAGYPFVHADQHNLTPVVLDSAAQSFRLINCNDGGVEYSDNGGISWNKTLNGKVTTQFYGADKRPGSSEYIGGTQDNGTWQSGTDPSGSDPWLSQLGGDGFDASWHYTDPDKIIGSIQYNSFYRTTDGGNSWEPAVTGMSDVGSGAGIFISAIGKSQSDPDLLFAVGVSGIWRSDNFAEDWTLTPIGSQWGFTGLSGQVKISRANPQIVWAGNAMTSNSRVFVSQDGGISFTATNNYAGTTLGRITGLDTHPLEDSTAFLTFSIANAPKILRTTDLGQSWQDISGFGINPVSTNGFPNVATYCVLVMPHAPDTIWAGTEIGLFESTDNGTNWHFANNGLPAVSIWDMRVVDDQVVVATHGRGIWSVTIPELLNSPPPVVTLSPRLDRLAQSPSGDLNIDVALRSVYDSTQIYLDNLVSRTIFNPAPLDTVFNLPVTQAANLEVFVLSYKNGETYKSAVRSVNVVPLSPPQVTYINDLNSPGNDFSLDGFLIYTHNAFSDNAIHSGHPYGNNEENTAFLKIPITVASANAIVEFDEIALIEPGEAGSHFGDQDFWDYVVVEGTKDGLNWLPLEDGYDARLHSEWLNVYNSGASGSPLLFKPHHIDLLNTFSPGDDILIRFRMFTDGAVTGWGWLIDNIRIQENATAIAGNNVLPNAYNLSQNYPNPFNPETQIRFQLPRSGKITLKIFNSLGQEIRTLVKGNQPAGTRTVVWDGTDMHGRPVASGIYIYRLDADDYQAVRKMIFLK